MKKTISGLVILGFLITTIFTSCDSGKSNKQEGFDYTETGLAYKFHILNDTAAQPEIGKLAFVKMKYRSDDTTFYDSDVMPDGLVPIPVTEPVYAGDLMEGLQMMHLGDSATFLVQADSFFLKTARFPEIPEYAIGIDVLIFDVKMMKIKTEDEARKDYERQLVDLQVAEDSILQAYLLENNIKTKPTETGLYFKNLKEGRGPLAQKGDLVTVEFNMSKLDGTEIFSTEETGEPVFFELGQPFDTEGMNQALLKMKEGGKARVIIPSSLAFGKRGRSNLIPPFTTLIGELELMKIQTKEEYNDEQRLGETDQIKKYLNENGITQKPTATGLYVVERVKGDGPKAEPGDKVKVWYTGKLLDGTVFDASSNRNQAFEFTLGQGRVIKGWDEGIAQMNQGSKATLIIPSNLGYGERGSGQRIPPFSPLVFEVELQEVIKE